MPKKDKPKPNKGVRNDNRKNGKANKKGTVRHTKNPLDGVTQVIMGKGQHRTMKHVSCTSWLGTNTVTIPFNKDQAELNKKLYPYLFNEV